MDLFQYSESIVIDASPEALSDLATDIGRTGEWSPICRTCRWQDGEGAREGAWFYGRNEAGGNVWETDSQVAVAQRGREFAWLVGGNYARDRVRTPGSSYGAARRSPAFRSLWQR